MEERKVATLAEVKDVLVGRQDERELTPEQKLALEHCQRFARTDAKKAKKLMKELSELGVVSDTNAAKICDLMPTHPDDVRVIFAKERTNLDKKDIEKILSIVEKYL
jgi:DNA-directed RNA polymerase subunit F